MDKIQGQLWLQSCLDTPRHFCNIFSSSSLHLLLLIPLTSASSSSSSSYLFRPSYSGSHFPFTIPYFFLLFLLLLFLTPLASPFNSLIYLFTFLFSSSSSSSFHSSAFPLIMFLNFSSHPHLPNSSLIYLSPLPFHPHRLA